MFVLTDDAYGIYKNTLEYLGDGPLEFGRTYEIILTYVSSILSGETIERTELFSRPFQVPLSAQALDSESVDALIWDLEVLNLETHG